MTGSLEMCQKEVRLCRKGRNHLESRQITTRRCGEKRSVQRVVETLKKHEYVCKMVGYLCTSSVLFGTEDPLSTRFSQILPTHLGCLKMRLPNSLGGS
jgi:hypothetical protein